MATKNRDRKGTGSVWEAEGKGRDGRQKGRKVGR